VLVRVSLVAALAVPWLGQAGTAQAQLERPAREGRTFKVRIESEPSGATVYLDSRDGGAVGTTPVTAELQAGSWRLILDKDGYTASVTTFEVKLQRRTQRIRVELMALVTGVLVLTAPEGDLARGADVMVDGRRIGVVPDEFVVEVGPHQVLVAGDADLRYEEWIEVAPGERVEVLVELGMGEPEGAGVEVATPAPRLDEPRPEPEARDGASRESSAPRDDPPPVGDGGRAALMLETGLAAGGRHFSYLGPTSGNLRPYDADGVAMFHLGIDLYPMARHARRALRALGLSASLDSAFSIESQTTDGMAVDTRWSQFSAGLRWRAPIGPALLGFGLGYGAIAFEFDTDGTLADEVPTVDYRYVRYAADGRLDLGKLGVQAGAALLQVVSSGEVADRFRDATASGLEGHLGVSWRVGSMVEARLAGRYQRIRHHFVASTDDTVRADAATDQLYGILLGGAYIY
jgi:hypothetical protein